jgi:hypothetical protein
MFWDLPSAEDAAYESARDAFEAKRERLVDQAVDAHEAGDEAKAAELMAKARAMVFTGLHNDED